MYKKESINFTKKMKLNNESQKTKIEKLIDIIKKEREKGYLPIFDKYSISVKELSLIYDVDPTEIYFVLFGKKSIDSIKEFEQELKKIHHSLQIEWKMWNIFIPYDIHNIRRTFRFGKYELKIVSKNRLFKEIAKRDKSKNLLTALNNFQGKFLNLKVHAKNFIHASDLIENDFYLLRGIIEYSENVYMSKTTSHLENLVSLTHPKYIFLISSKKCEHIEYYVPPSSRNSHSLSLSQHGIQNLNKIQSIIKKLKDNEFDTYNILISIFRLYAYALEEEYGHSRFLRFWQIAEIFAKKIGKDGRKDEVISILTFFMKQSNNLKNLNYSLVLKDWVKKRNDYVHEGLNHITKADALNLKNIIDIGIDWLLDYSVLLKTETHLKEFYRLHTNSNDVSILKDVIKLIK
jgi:hypothetical protein